MDCAETVVSKEVLLGDPRVPQKRIQTFFSDKTSQYKSISLKNSLLSTADFCSAQITDEFGDSLSVYMGQHWIPPALITGVDPEFFL